MTTQTQTRKRQPRGYRLIEHDWGDYCPECADINWLVSDGADDGPNTGYYEDRCGNELVPFNEPFTCLVCGEDC